MDMQLIILGALGLVSLVLLVVAIVKLSALSDNVARLADQVHNSGMTTPELGQKIGGAIDEALRQYMPKPGDVSSSIAGSVDTAVKGALKSVEELQKRVVDAQGSLLTKWVEYEGRITSSMDATSRAMGESAKQYGTSLGAVSQKMVASFDEGAEKLNQSMKQHAEKAAASCAQLSAQIEKVAAFQQEVGKLVHLQQATDSTIKSVAASEDFKELIKSIRGHLDTTDKALKDIIKPRTIRLVESEQ